MKILLLILAGLLSISLLASDGNRSSKSSRTQNDPPKAITESGEQDPVQEWDPLTQGIGDLTEGPRTEVAPAQRKKITIEGRLFRPEQFAAFVKNSVAPEFRKRDQWKPQFIVLHHTGIPSIRQRPHGFTTANMSSLATYYGISKGWRSGPHLFVDQNGIWVFTALTKRGTHSPSWNNVAWGIEQLGNFTDEDYTTGPGQKIRDNALAAVAILSLARNLDPNTLHFHLDDPRTTHKWCPGSSCKKDEVISQIKVEIEKWRAMWGTL